jgi:iron complex outermembrane recepter protein
MNKPYRNYVAPPEATGKGLPGRIRSKRSRAGCATRLSGAEAELRPRSRENAGFAVRARRTLIVAFAAVFLASSVWAQNGQNIPDVTAMSVEDLMNLQVTSVSKRTQKLADAAAAIFVITQEDIERSGARSIPEALRMVPGLEVARIDENKWAIGSRGFNGRFDNKLLVLIDGRSVYTPLFSGVYWDVQDVMLEDVDRIEVIRGPGATLWGANAVDGVINIISKPAKSTQSGIVKVEGGNEERTTESARYGDKIGKNGFYRAYMKYFDWGSSTDTTGQKASDGWHALRGGFRSDWTPSHADSLTVQGDVYHTNDGETLTAPSLTPPYSSTFANTGDYSGGNLLGRWNHSFANSSMSVQAYYDRTNFSDNFLFIDHESVYDVDFQNDLHIGQSHELVWGLGYRSIQDRNASSFLVSVEPNQHNYNQFSAFLQDEVSLFDKRLRVTVGSKLEHNEFTGFEVEPNVRFLGNISTHQSVWAAISRAVRTPALTEEGLRLNEAVVPPGVAPFNSPLPVIEAVLGSNQFKSEDLLAYEVGYRVQATSSFSADIAAFYNNYSNLRTAEPGTPFVEGSPAPTDVVVPFVASNKMSGGTYGIEPFADWRVLPKWRLLGSYSFLRMAIHKNSDSLDPTPDLPNGESPEHQFYFRSSVDLPRHVEQDLSVRYVDKLGGLNIPSYYSLDAGLRWKPISNLELAFDGQNWLNKRHIEFVPDFINTLPTVVGRSYRGSITWRFGKS